MKDPIMNSTPSLHERWLICAILSTKSRSTDLWKAQALAIKNIAILEEHGTLAAAMPFTEELAVSPLLGQEMRDFSDVVNHLHRFGDILPFRFGMILSRQEWAKTIESKKALYQTSLDRIASCSEINLRWAIPDPTDGAEMSARITLEQKPAKGYSYLAAKLEARQLQYQVEKEADAVAEQLKSYYPETCVGSISSVRKLSVKNTSDEDVVYSIAKVDLLVRREAVDSILKTASMLHVRSEMPTVASGPWPPFSFLVSEEVKPTALPMQRCAKTLAMEAVG
jgi:hypothetical protein